MEVFKEKPYRSKQRSSPARRSRHIADVMDQNFAATRFFTRFFIGAHQAAKGPDLLTRDVGHYSSYFPKHHLIAPD